METLLSLQFFESGMFLDQECFWNQDGFWNVLGMFEMFLETRLFPEIRESTDDHLHHYEMHPICSLQQKDRLITGVP